jgi:DNA-binding ferritin-like protein (Dps family)
MYFTIFINRSFKQTKKENIIDMNVVENDVKELSKKYCKKEKLIKIMIEKSLELGYNENDTINNIIEFMEKQNS